MIRSWDDGVCFSVRHGSLDLELFWDLQISTHHLKTKFSKRRLLWPRV